MEEDPAVTSSGPGLMSPAGFPGLVRTTADSDHHHDYVLVDTDYNPRLPNGVVVAVLMAVGLVGNALVLYVYHFKMPRTVFTTFVVVLAALDLTTALVGMPIDVVIKTATLGESPAFSAACKLAHLEVYSTSLASGSVLLLIALTRHAKVCRPLEPGLSTRKARALCALIVAGAATLCLVTLFINGVEMVQVAVGERDYDPSDDDGNLTTNSSSGTGSSASPSQLVYEAGTSAQVLTPPEDLAADDDSDPASWHGRVDGGSGSVAAVGSWPRNASGAALSKRTEVVRVYICRTSEESKGTAMQYALQALLGTAFIAIFIALLVLHWRISSSVARFERRLSSMRRGSAQSDATHITASMFRIFATITVIFVVSYLPHLVCLVVEKALFAPEEPMPQAVRVLVDLAYNFPYINVVANPFIYGYRSVVFRQHCLELLRRLCCCCCCCCCCGRKHYR